MAIYWQQAHAHFMRKTSDIIWQDAQHQRLFEMLELITQPDTCSSVLIQLGEYAEYHFSLEERYMEELDFPGRVRHIEAHNRFRVEIDKLLNADSEPDAVFREIIGTFLTEWLTRHVFGTDKTLEAFILRSGAH